MENLFGLLPIPKNCDSCQSEKIKFVENKALYGENQGAWPYVYLCQVCEAAVGCHNGTRFPLGRMASRKIRQLRTEVHSIFDKLWKGGLMDRTKAYKWLSFELGLNFDECHIGWMQQSDLEKALILTNDYYNRYYLNLLKRKVKQNAKLEKRNRRNLEREDRSHDEGRFFASRRNKYRGRNKRNIEKVVVSDFE